MSTPGTRMTTKMARTAMVVAILAASALAACGRDPAPGEASGTTARPMAKATLMLDWTPNTNHSGIYLAKSKGWYADAGIDLTIVQPGKSTSLQALGSGRAQFAVTVSEEIVPARAEGVPTVSIAAIIEHNTSSLISLAGDKITRPRELEGKKYGGFGGQLERALIERLVRCDGGDPAKVSFVEVGNVDYRVGLERDFYDVAWVFDAWDVIRLRDLEGVAIDRMPFIDYPSCIPDWYTPVLATSEEMISKQPEVVRSFMTATARGYRAAMAAPGEAATALLAGAPELDRRLVEASSTHLALRYASDPEAWGRQDKARWEAFVTFLTEAGLVKKPIDVDAAFTNRFLPGG